MKNGHGFGYKILPILQGIRGLHTSYYLQLVLETILNALTHKLYFFPFRRFFGCPSKSKVYLFRHFQQYYSLLIGR